MIPFRMASFPLILLCVSTQLLAEAPSSLDEWVAQMQADRTQAEALVDQGNLRAAADLLAASWRGLPPAYPELADTATASMQLLLFIMEYLMDEPTVSLFVAESLNPQPGDSDKFIRTVYDVAIGQETAGKTQATIEMTYLTESANPFVRIGALFMLSDPYYFTDPAFVKGMSGILARDFPNLTVTQEAIRLSLYAVADEDPDVIEQALGPDPGDPTKAQGGTPSQNAAEAAIARVLSNDEVAGALREALPDLAADPPRALQKLCNNALNASEWRTRYGCLLIAERRPAQSSAAFKTTFSNLAKRENRTPDVAHARVLAGNEFRGSYTPEKSQTTLDEAARAALQLLQTDWTAFPYERNLYEECLKEVQNMAAWMAEQGHVETAKDLYRALAQKYPNSLVSSACTNRLEELAKNGD